MAEYLKPEVLNKIWASQGVVNQPTDFKWNLGYIQEKPEFETMNFWMQQQDKWSNYSNQKGLPEYDSTTDYVKNKSFIQFNGSIYKAKENTNGVSPQQDVSGSVWLKVFSAESTALDASNVTSFIRPLLLSNNINEVDSFLGVSTVGKSLVRTQGQAEARTAIGITNYWSNLLTNSTVSQSQSALGFSDYGKGLIDKNNSSDTLDYLGATVLGKQLFTSTNQNNALNILGATTTGINILKSANGDAALSSMSVSSLGIDFLKQTSYQNMRLKIGMTSFSSSLSQANNTDEHFTTLGYSPFVRGLIGSTNDSVFRSNIGANNASNLNTGTLPIDRIANNAIGDNKLSGNYIWSEGSRYTLRGTDSKIDAYLNGTFKGTIAYTSQLPSNSSTSNAGLVREATQLQMSNKTTESVYVKPSVVADGSSYSFTNAAQAHMMDITFPSWMGGYRRRSGRLTVGGNGTVTLNDLFSNACLSVSGTLDVSMRSDQRPIHVTITTSRGVQFKNPDSNTAIVWWTADGY